MLPFTKSGCSIIHLAAHNKLIDLGGHDTHSRPGGAPYISAAYQPSARILRQALIALLPALLTKKAGNVSGWAGSSDIGIM